MRLEHRERQRWVAEIARINQRLNDDAGAMGMAVGDRKDPYLAFNFLVEIQGLTVGGFTEVTGLQVEVEVHDYREGGVNEYIHKMTQSSQDPHGYPDREAPDQGGDPELRGNGAQLAERIWGRYGGSPGVIPTATALARRVSRLSAGRLPLLAAVQRRWAVAHLSFPRGPSALPYARPPVFVDPRPPSAHVVQPTPEEPPRSSAAPSPMPSAIGRLSLRRMVWAQPAVGVSPSPLAVGGRPQPPEILAAQEGVTEGSDLGAAIWRRHLSGPAARAIQRQVEPTALGPPAGRTTAGARAGLLVSSGEGARQPAGEGERPLIGVRVAPPTAAGVGDLGLAIRRRYLSDPAGEAIQRRGGLPGPAQPATVRRRMHQVIPPTATDAGQMVMASTAYGSRVRSPPSTVRWKPLSRVATCPGQTITMRQPALPLSRTPLPGTGMFSGMSGLSREPYAASQEMPLLRMAERRVAGAGGGSAMPVSTRPAISGAPLGFPSQRAGREAPVGTQAETPGAVPSPPAGEPPSPTTETPGLEGPDLERLADEVYAIIERRLTIERESLGL